MCGGGAGAARLGPAWFGDEGSRYPCLGRGPLRSRTLAGAARARCGRSCRCDDLPQPGRRLRQRVPLDPSRPQVRPVHRQLGRRSVGKIAARPGMGLAVERPLPPPAQQMGCWYGWCDDGVVPYQRVTMRLAGPLLGVPTTCNLPDQSPALAAARAPTMQTLARGAPGSSWMAPLLPSTSTAWQHRHGTADGPRTTRSSSTPHDVGAGGAEAQERPRPQSGWRHVAEAGPRPGRGGPRVHEDLEETPRLPPPWRRCSRCSRCRRIRLTKMSHDLGILGVCVNRRPRGNRPQDPTHAVEARGPQSTTSSLRSLRRSW